MKLADFRILTDAEMAEADEQRARWGAAETCRQWAVASCRMARGHDWYLDISPYDGVTLWCRKCPAGIDDVYPDGYELLTGEFEVFPGYVLCLRCADVEVNDKFTYGLFTYGWRGPVTVNLHVEKYTSMDWIGTEVDVWIEVDPV